MLNFGTKKDADEYVPGGLFREAKKILLWMMSVDAVGFDMDLAARRGVHYLNQMNVLIYALSSMRNIVMTMVNLCYPSVAAAGSIMPLTVIKHSNNYDRTSELRISELIAKNTKNIRADRKLLWTGCMNGCAGFSMTGTPLVSSVV